MADRVLQDCLKTGASGDPAQAKHPAFHTPLIVTKAEVDEALAILEKALDSAGAEPVARNKEWRLSMAKKVVLAYSGGLDTSVAIKWIADKYNMDVIALTIDVGNERDFISIQQRALKTGAIKSLVLDANDLFVRYFYLPCPSGRCCL